MKYAISALLAIHGVIHAMGFAGAWGIAEFDGASRTPTNFVVAEPDSGALRGLGIVWLVALGAFVISAGLLLGGNPAWRGVALGAAALSMVVVALWWESAPMGAVANALIIIAVVMAPSLEGVPS